MQALVRSEVDVSAPAGLVWSYVTDWPRQGDWIPLTRVEAVDAADGVGGRIRAWNGIGRVGFWDTMTITAWEQYDNGSARCEVLHTGAVVRGDGEFAVEARDEETCRFVWWERLDIPGGWLGALGWRAVRPLAQRGVDHAVSRFAVRAEDLYAAV
ncbi:MAG: SRPBCC family protein [Actinomycetota bacterium]